MEIRIPKRPCAADDKASVFPDNVGVHQRIVFIQRQDVFNIVNRKPCHQSFALLPVGHVIAGRDRHKDQMISVLVGPHRDLLLVILY